MNNLASQFNVAASKSGVFQLDASLKQHLKQVTDQYATLVKSAYEGGIDGDEEAPEPIMDAVVENKGASEPRSQEQQLIMPSRPSDGGDRVDIGWGYSADIVDRAQNSTHWQSPPVPREIDRNLSTRARMPNAPMYGSDKYDPRTMRPPVTVGGVLDQAMSWNSKQASQRNESGELPFGMVDMSQQQYPSGTQNSQSDFLTPEATPPSKSLPPSPLNSLTSKPMVTNWTYSHDETTFARRLARAAFEAGYHLLSVANQRPATINRVFRLWVPQVSVEELRQNFKALLARGVHEDLESWDSPFPHIGGAGTHYPRKDAQGNSVTTTNEWTCKRIGPASSTMIRIENSKDPSKNREMNVDLTGFEGEWFDAYDVEGYLEQEKGCHIDPKMSFAEVLIDDDFDEDPDSPKKEYFFNSLKGGGPLHSPPTPPPPPPPAPIPQQTSAPQSMSANETRSQERNTSANENDTNNLFAQTDVPFGLDMDMDMAMNMNMHTANMAPLDFNLFDEPIGLDLAPTFTFDQQDQLPPHNFLPLRFEDNEEAGPSGLELRGESGIIKRGGNRNKKAAWVDVSKFVDGKSRKAHFGKPCWLTEVRYRNDSACRVPGKVTRI